MFDFILLLLALLAAVISCVLRSEDDFKGWLSSVITLICLASIGVRFIDLEAKLQAKPADDPPDVRACLLSEKKVEERKKWCSEVGWKREEVEGKGNPYQQCLTTQVRMQRLDCEHENGR